MACWTLCYVLQNSRLCYVYSLIILNTHTVTTSSEFVAAFIKRLPASFWMEFRISEGELMSRFYGQTGPCQQIGGGVRADSVMFFHPWT